MKSSDWCCCVSHSNLFQEYSMNWVSGLKQCPFVELFPWLHLILWAYRQVPWGSSKLNRQWRHSVPSLYYTLHTVSMKLYVGHSISWDTVKATVYSVIKIPMAHALWRPMARIRVTMDNNFNKRTAVSGLLSPSLQCCDSQCVLASCR